MRKLIIVVIALFLLPLVSAKLTVTDEAVKNVIMPDEGASFNIDVSSEDASDNYGIITTDSNWRLKGKSSIDLEQGKKQSIKLEFYPIGAVKPGSYSVNLRVYSNTKPENFADHPIFIKLVSPAELIEAGFEYNPQGLDPKKENLVKLNVKNKNPISLDDVKIKIESSLFDDERIISLLPSESRSEELRVSFKDFIEKGSYEVRLLVTMKDKTLIDRTEKINVGYYSDVTDDNAAQEGFLIKNIKVIRENKGNVVADEEYSLRLNSFEKTFTSVHPEPTEINSKDGLYYYKWDFKINPGDSYRIEIKTDYRTLLISLILGIVIIIVAYHFFKKDVSIKKKVLTIRYGGGISEMKVLLIIKNKGRALKHVQVTDRLPKIIKKPVEFGIVKPASFRHEMGEGIFTWNLEGLVRNEERVISYKIKSDIKVIGKMHIPVAIGRYRTKTGNLVTVKSNKNIIIS